MIVFFCSVCVSPCTFWQLEQSAIGVLKHALPSSRPGGTQWKGARTASIQPVQCRVCDPVSSSGGQPCPHSVLLFHALRQFDIAHPISNCTLDKMKVERKEGSSIIAQFMPLLTPYQFQFFFDAFSSFKRRQALL